MNIYFGIYISFILGLNVLIFYIFKSLTRRDLRRFLLFFTFLFLFSLLPYLLLVLFNDTSQQSKDAYNFYVVSSELAAGLSIREIMVYTEGSGSIVVWRFFYEFSKYFGIDKTRFVGILINILLISWSYVFVNKTINVLARIGIKSFRNIFWKIVLSPMYILFATIHLRESFIILTISILLYLWVCFLVLKSRESTLLLIVFSLFFSITLPFLRTEYVVVPGLFFVLYCVVEYLYYFRSRPAISVVILITLLPVFFLIYKLFLSSYIDAVFYISDSYAAVSKESSDSSSLGYGLIVSRGFVLRAFLGSVYVLFYPIPFWNGLFENSSISIFKSLNALWILSVFPTFSYNVIGILLKRDSHYKSALFLVMVFLVFLILTALTSLETRHISVFYGVIFIISSLSLVDIKRFGFVLYRKIYFLLVFTVYCFWALLKYL